jgi:UDP-glucose:(heptosyl)LPS alpha-1,3-glucosyltransferase
VHLLVVGRGRPAPFRRLSRRLGVEERTHFIGATSAVQRYYAAGDLLVLPTLYDPFANVCLEAMACGLPVVTTAGNGAAEIIIPGENGFVQHDPGNAAELASLLAECLDRSRLLHMSDRARETAIPFTCEHNMTQTCTLFQQRLTDRYREEL